MNFEETKASLRSSPKKWLVTGVAGFIGSHLLESLLKLDQVVVGVDNFITGKRQNLTKVQHLVSRDQWGRFLFVEGDIRDISVCHKVCSGADSILHEAALGSVPRSIKDPLTTNEHNVVGTLNIFHAAINAKVKRVVYASSSSVYGNVQDSIKVEDSIGEQLSPYALTKRANELYADVFSRVYGLKTIGLRYFNVFGPRQDPDGPYAAVIPKWISAMLNNQPVYINGTGEISRDFCFVENVVQMNLLAATTDSEDAVNRIYNVACSDRTTLNELFEIIRANLMKRRIYLCDFRPTYRAFREGDVMHSLARIDNARRLLQYAPTHNVKSGLELTMKWYQDENRSYCQRCRISDKFS